MSYQPYIPEPTTSPWGEVQHCTEIAYGMYEVSTAGHGGVMVHVDVATAALSPGARKWATMRERNYLCYEEDCDAAIPFRELLDKPGWEIPKTRTGSREDFEKSVDNMLLAYNPDYVRYREYHTGKSIAHAQMSFDDMQR